VTSTTGRSVSKSDHQAGSSNFKGNDGKIGLVRNLGIRLFIEKLRQFLELPNSLTYEFFHNFGYNLFIIDQSFLVGKVPASQGATLKNNDKSGLAVRLM